MRRFHVSFKSRYQGVDHYTIFDRETMTERSARIQDGQFILCHGYLPTDDERAAIQAHLDAQNRDYEEWLAARPHLLGSM